MNTQLLEVKHHKSIVTRLTWNDVLLALSAVGFLVIAVWVGLVAKPAAAKPEQPFTLACTDTGCAP